MKLFVGLGNPGEKYVHTRHNVGWLCLDYLRDQYALPPFSDQKKVHAEITKNEEYLLAKPQTFMNDSGKAVQAILKWYGGGEQEVYRNLFIFHDDLDIELGKFKLQFASGPKVHNGINSVRNYLKTDQFWVVRIGVDDRQGNRSMAGSDYVLQQLSTKSVQLFQPIFDQIHKELRSV